MLISQKTETDLKKNDSVNQKGSNTETSVDNAKTTPDVNSDTKNKKANETTTAADNATLDNLEAKYEKLETQLEVGKISEDDAQKAAEELQNEMAQLPEAAQLKAITLKDVDTKTSNTSEVSDWLSFVNVLNNTNVNEIKLTSNIDVTGKVDEVTTPKPTSDKRYLNSKGIARKVVIEGKNDTGDNYSFIV